MAPRRGAGRVVGLGLCVVDHLYVVERIDPSAGRVYYVERRVASGGMVGNALTQVARLGCEAHVLSAVGDDADGRFVRRSLRAAGVVTRRLVRDDGCPTTIAVVQVERRSGERHFLVADRRTPERRAPDFDLAPIKRRAVLLIDGHFPSQARRAVRRARDVGAVVVADFHLPLPELTRLLPFVDYPVVPMGFAREYAPGAPRETLWRLREESGGTPVVTMGARGGLYLEAGRVRRFRAPRVRVLDTTGAGDAFHGAFAAAIARGLDVRTAIEWGARAGALCCTALGATSRLMTAAEGLARNGRAKGGARTSPGRALARSVRRTEPEGRPRAR